MSPSFYNQLAMRFFFPTITCLTTVGLLTWVGSSGPLWASKGPLAPEASSRDHYFLGPFWGNLSIGARRAYSGAPLAALLFGAVPLSVAIGSQDRSFQAMIERRQPLGVGAKIGNLVGQPYGHLGLIGAVYLVERWMHPEALERTSARMLEAWTLTTLSVHLIKPIAHRRRPDGSDCLSFPSQHAAGSFALAATLQKRQGWGIGLPAYGAAAFIAFSRLETGKHFASDTFFGAWLGLNAAYALGQRKLGPRPVSVRFHVLPDRAAMTVMF